MELIEGDKIKWSYVDHLNSKSRIKRTKTGVYIRRIRTEHIDGGFRHTFSTHCLVQLKGNKNPSRVLISEVFKK